MFPPIADLLGRCKKRRQIGWIVAACNRAAVVEWVCAVEILMGPGLD